ncbi:MAG: EAL domain-containing protein (putative c-di-GMP-specific phosphodiesterase class I) [Oleiphilaceae bacterium]|jgi:EAL domain-containing protein (putative c-di-GMP-specific phosphodiesterase class I)
MPRFSDGEMSEVTKIILGVEESKTSNINSLLIMGLRKTFLNPITYIGVFVMGTSSFLSADYSWGLAVPFVVPLFVLACAHILFEHEKHNNNQSEFQARPKGIKSVISGNALLNVFNKSLATNTPKLLIQIRINHATEVVRLTHEKSFQAEESLIFSIYQKISTEFFDGEVYRIANDTFLCIVDGRYEQMKKRIANFVNSHSPCRMQIDGHWYSPYLITGITPLNTCLAPTLTILEYACKKAFQSAQVSHYFVTGNESELKNNIHMRRGLQDVRRALEEYELGLFAQPIVPIDGTDLKPKYELLLRHYINDEIKSPHHILSCAKYNGVSQDIDMYVIEMLANNFHQLFNDRGANIESVSINISGNSYTSPYFNQALVTLFNLHDIPKQKIVLEVTEDIATENTDAAIANMHYLKNQGFKLALDDIGIGSSNFSNLSRFPVDYYKLDRFYGELMMTDVGIRGFVELIISEAHRRDKKVIAEGIPDQEALNYLKGLGVHFSQSFITGKPAEIIAAPRTLSQFKQ